MKIFNKKTKYNGKVKIYFLGIKIFSYKKNENINSEEKAKLEKIQIQFPIIADYNETINKIINGASLCRFGYAEFDIGVGEGKNKDDPYQCPSEELSNRLFKILNTKSTDKLLIAIPPFKSDEKNPKTFYKNITFWEWYWLTRWNLLKKFISQKKYYNSLVSRTPAFEKIDIEKFKKIWDKKEVVFVIGKGGRFNEDIRLFSNIKKKDYIYVPPTQAFNEYDNILKQCLKYKKNKMFFISAGPTATVLAYDLHKAGYQALDFGHLPNCYAEFLKEQPSPESFPMINSNS